MQFILGWFIFSGAAVFFAGSAYAQAPSSNLLEVVKASKGEEVQRLLDSVADAHVVPLFSLANMHEPGTFMFDEMKWESTRMENFRSFC